MFSYVAGDLAAGIALVAKPFVLLLEPGYELDRAKQLWQIVSAPGSTFEDILSALIKQGMANLPSFALLEMLDDGKETAIVAVRGTAAVETASGVITAEDATTWVEAQVQADRGLRVSAGDLVHSEAVHQGATAIDDVSMPLIGGMVTAQSVTIGDFEPLALFKDEFLESIEHTHLSARRAKPTDSAQPEEITTLSRRLNEWVLYFNTGQKITVAGHVVIGRRPVLLPEDPEGAVTETLLSPQREISGRHACLIPTPEGILVKDANSTNGSIARPAEGAPVLLKDGAEFLLKADDGIDFGDGNIAVCARP